MRAADRATGHLEVAVDATPLLGPRTGVGEFCAGALAGLAERADLSVSAFAVSWRRRRGIVASVPVGVRAVDRPMPARPLHLAWRHLAGPPVEWWTGRADVVHGTNFVVPPTRRAGRVVTVHDLITVHRPELCDPSTLAFPDLVRRAIRAGAWVHTPSHFVADEVVAILGADPQRVRVVPHGVPGAGRPAGWQPEGRCEPGGTLSSGTPPEAPYVLALGTVEPRKDLPGLVRAFDVVAARNPEVRLVVAGPDGWGIEAFSDAVAAARAAERIVRLGYVTESLREELLGGAAVLAYPSVYEGFGFPPLQAMRRGVPVVATRAGAVPEVVGEAALLVASGDRQALAEALVAALYDEGVRERLRQAGLVRAATFTWERCAEGLAGLYWDARP